MSKRPPYEAGADAQCANAVMMIRPGLFMSNPQTAESNRFQDLAGTAAAEVVHPLALAEFEGLARARDVLHAR